VSKADLLDQMNAANGPPNGDHEIFHDKAMRATADIVRGFEQLRAVTAEKDTPEARAEYNAGCVSLAKSTSLVLGLTVGMSENPKHEVRLLLSLIVVFLDELVGQCLPSDGDIEFARTLCESLEHDGVTH
jgi:hypothetical protein